MSTLIINIFFFQYMDRIYTSDSEIHRREMRQILTSKVDPRPRCKG